MLSLTKQYFSLFYSSVTEFTKFWDARERERVKKDKVVEYFTNWDLSRNLRGKLCSVIILKRQNWPKNYIKIDFSKVLFLDECQVILDGHNDVLKWPKEGRKEAAVWWDGLENYY